MERERMWKVRDLARFLGLSPEAVYTALSRGEEGTAIPPRLRLGRKRYLIPSIVETWLIKKVQTSRPCLDSESLGISCSDSTTHRTQLKNCPEFRAQSGISLNTPRDSCEYETHHSIESESCK
jgi:hypothetical protein